MPIYEYQCTDCGGEFEELVSTTTAESSLACPKCGSGAVQKKMSCFSKVTGATGNTGPSGAGPPGCGFT